MTNSRKWGTLLVACLAMLLLSVDLTVLHLAVPTLVRDLNPTATELLWITDIYGFALAGLLVTMGNIGDRIGRKRLLMIGAVAFGVASLVTAYASSPQMLIAARALLGVAGATIMPSTLSLIRNVFTDPKERTSAVGIWGSVSAIGFALGPIIGGVLLAHFWWGSVFLINVPLILLILVAGIILVPESRNPSPGKIDLVSVPLSIVAMLSLVYAIKEGFHGGVGQASVVACIVIGAVTLTVFLRRQTRLAEPLIDTKLFRRRAFSASVGVEVVVMFALLAMSLVFAQYFQLVKDWSPLVAGAASLPGGFSAGIGGALSGTLVPKWGRARVAALGLLMTATGLAMYSVLDLETPYLYMLAAMVVQGMGMGFAFAVTNDTMLASAPKERAGAAGAISETAHEIGGALGIAVLGSVLNSAYRNGLDLPAGLPAGLMNGAGEGFGETLAGTLRAAATLPADLGAAVAGAARQAFVDSMHVTVFAGAGLLVALAVVTLFALRGVPAVIHEEHEDEVPATRDAVVGAPVS